MNNHPYPKWKQDRCVHCAVGTPMSCTARYHWSTFAHEQNPCTAPTETEYIATLEAGNANLCTDRDEALRRAEAAESNLITVQQAYEAERSFIQQIESWVGADCRGSIGTGIYAAVNRLREEAVTSKSAQAKCKSLTKELLRNEVEQSALKARAEVAEAKLAEVQTPSIDADGTKYVTNLSDTYTDESGKVWEPLSGWAHCQLARAADPLWKRQEQGSPEALFVEDAEVGNG